MSTETAPTLISSIRAEYERYKALSEGALAQVNDADLCARTGDGSNSIAVLVWHLSGNLASRFTDFLTTDGEKPWRKRDEEFSARVVSRDELLKKWELGWAVLFSALDALTDADLQRVVMIRKQPLRVHQALQRSLAHASYHAGQIVLIARSFCGEHWKSLTIPPGGSQAYNSDPKFEQAGGHAEKLRASTDASREPKQK